MSMPTDKEIKEALMEYWGKGLYYLLFEDETGEEEDSDDDFDDDEPDEDFEDE